MSSRADLDIAGARRLAVASAGLLKADWQGLPSRAGRNPRQAALEVIRHFGYLQLDSVSVVGARTHGLVLLSRLDGFPPSLGEEMLQRGEPLFEYWGHEACWLPMELYPAFAFRRAELQVHRWWGDLIGANRGIADGLLRRIADEGPLRSTDFEGQRSGGWWNHKLSKKVAEALWSSGALAIAERRGFQRSYDLTERVIPEEYRSRPLALEESLEVLALRALQAHGWSTLGTIVATWRLANRRAEVEAALARLVESGKVLRSSLDLGKRKVAGYIRTQDRELAERLRTVRPRKDSGVLLSPFDPLLWDRARVLQLFGFEQFIEIYKKQEQRVFGYYVLPVLAGDRLIGRVDLKAERKAGRLLVQGRHFEAKTPSAADRAAMESAIRRLALSLGLQPQ
jgi:uncharacterized protein YcaQ